jgi:UDP-N-acetylglucosamine enolpyruvyl transferase
MAQGTSTIFGIDKINRGYEALDEKLGKIGAIISRVKE